MRSYSKFNTICILIAGFFVLATAYVWRGAFRNVQDVGNVVDVQIVTYKDIRDDKKEEDNNRTIEQCNNEECNNAEENSTEVVVSDDNNPLPKKINLDVPFTSQAPEKNWDQPWQDACEEAAVLMLDAYYKEYSLSPLFARDEILKMVEWEESSLREWERSIEIEKVEELTSWQMGSSYNFSIVEDPTIEQIKQFVANGNPVYVVAYGKDLPNPHFQNGGPEYHALIIRGYTEDSFITNDPGTQFGENFLYKYDDLMNAVHDWNGGDVENGRQVVLVLE